MLSGGCWWGLTLFLIFAGAQGCGNDSRPPAFDGAWRRHTIDDRFRGADGVRVADVNGDGWADVATGWEESGVTRAYLHPGNTGVREAWPAVTVGVTPISSSVTANASRRAASAGWPIPAPITDGSRAHGQATSWVLTIEGL